MYALYSTLLGLFLLITLPYWLLQMMRHGKYRAGLRQRLGAAPAQPEATQRKTHDLGPCRVRGRGGRIERGGRGTASEISFSSGCRLDHHQHRAEAGRPPLWSRKRLLLPARLRLRDSALPRRPASGAGGRRRNRILAELSPAREKQRSANRSHQLPHF